jgi:hypothetical protein
VVGETHQEIMNFKIEVKLVGSLVSWLVMSGESLVDDGLGNLHIMASEIKSDDLIIVGAKQVAKL